MRAGPHRLAGARVAQRVGSVQGVSPWWRADRREVSILTKHDGLVQRRHDAAGAPDRGVSILTKHDGLVQPEQTVIVDIAWVVSILTKHDGLVQLVTEPLRISPPRSFNPHQARWPGATTRKRVEPCRGFCLDAGLSKNLRRICRSVRGPSVKHLPSSRYCGAGARGSVLDWVIGPQGARNAEACAGTPGPRHPG